MRCASSNASHSRPEFSGKTVKARVNVRDSIYEFADAAGFCFGRPGDHLGVTFSIGRGNHVLRSVFTKERTFSVNFRYKTNGGTPSSERQVGGSEGVACPATARP